MNYQHITSSLKDGVLEIVLNRPDKLNAYTAIMGDELADAFRRADTDDAVRVVLVTGAGRVFCAAPTSRPGPMRSTPPRPRDRRRSAM